MSSCSELLYSPTPSVSSTTPDIDKPSPRGTRAPKGSTYVQKNPEQVKRRNARERRRVQAVNSAFIKLRDRVPDSARGKKISKVDTLKAAADYIHYLQGVLDANGGGQCEALSGFLPYQPHDHQEYYAMNHTSATPPAYAAFPCPAPLSDISYNQQLPNSECVNTLASYPQSIINPAVYNHHFGTPTTDPSLQSASFTVDSAYSSGHATPTGYAFMQIKEELYHHQQQPLAFNPDVSPAHSVQSPANSSGISLSDDALNSPPQCKVPKVDYVSNYLW